MAKSGGRWLWAAKAAYLKVSDQEIFADISFFTERSEHGQKGFTCGWALKAYGKIEIGVPFLTIA